MNFDNLAKIARGGKIVDFIALTAKLFVPQVDSQRPVHPKFSSPMTAPHTSLLPLRPCDGCHPCDPLGSPPLSPFAPLPSPPPAVVTTTAGLSFVKRKAQTLARRLFDRNGIGSDPLLRLCGPYCCQLQALACRTNSITSG